MFNYLTSTAAPDRWKNDDEWEKRENKLVSTQYENLNLNLWYGTLNNWSLNNKPADKWNDVIVPGISVVIHVVFIGPSRQPCQLVSVAWTAVDAKLI